MNRMRGIGLIFAGFLTSGTLLAQTAGNWNSLAREIFKQLVEINTTDSSGSTTVAAEAMAKRLRDAGYPAADIFVGRPKA